MAKKVTGPKSRAWNAFSQWVRVSGCILTTGYPFVGNCVTCGKRYHIRYLEAGHCFAGRRNGILFHEELTNQQCRRCNQILHGQPKKYRKIMEEKHGEDQVAQWDAERKKPTHDRDMDFEAIVKDYKIRTKELLEPFGYHSFEDMLQGHQI